MMIKKPKHGGIIDGLFYFIMNHRMLVSVVFLGITIFFAWFAANTRFDNTIETYFLEKDLEDYRQFLDQFGTDEIIAIAFGEEDVFTVDTLKLIDAISRKLKGLPHVRRVLSLTTAKIVHGEGKEVSFNRLIKKMPPDPGELISIKKKALLDPFLPGILLSPDARRTAIIAEIDHIIGEFDYKVELLGQIRDFLKQKEIQTGKHFSIGGTSVLDDALFRNTQSDQTRFFPMMIGVIILIMFLMFRRITLTLLPLLVVLLSAVWTYGFLVLLGYKINVISTIIGPLLLAVAIADSMHFIADYLHETAAGTLSKTECIRRTFRKLIAPCAMTSLTTAFGLLSLLSADLVPIRQFGLVSAGGILFALIITLFLLPIFLSAIPYPKERHRRQIQTGFFSNVLLHLGTWRKQRAITVLSICLFALFPAVFLLFHLDVGTNSLDYFKKDDVVRLQTEWIDTGIGGTASLEFIVDAGKADALKDPVLLRKIKAFQDYLKKIEGVTGVYSPVDLVKSLNRAFHGGDERYFSIPGSSIVVAQQLFIVEGSKEARALLSDDYSLGRITTRVEMDASQKLSHHMPKIIRRMHEIFDGAARIRPTGVVYLMNQMEHYLLSSQMKSFFVAFLIIGLSMVLMLRSLKLGMLAMIPNFLPILFTMGLMPLLKIALDVGTVMIAGVALGLIVDDTIHFLSRLKLEMKTSDDIAMATVDTMNGTGRPIIFTSIVLSLGFLVLTFASFNPVIHFGILSSIVIILALVADLVVLPALLGFVRLRSKRAE